MQEILRERDHGGFSERNDFGSRMGGGMDVSLCVCVSARIVGLVVFEPKPSLEKICFPPSDPGTTTLSRSGHWAQWRDDQENPK